MQIALIPYEVIELCQASLLAHCFCCTLPLYDYGRK